jgi:hypothetical protein
MSTQVDANSPEEAHATEYAIVVNGAPSSRTERCPMRRTEAVTIAYPEPDPNATYTVTYSHAASAPHEGFLVPGAVVEVKKAGTEFDVSPTGKS